MKALFIFATALMAMAAAKPGVRAPMFSLVTGKYQWEDARTVCRGYGGTIARIYTCAEHDMARKFATGKKEFLIKISYEN